ncbi:hypothetical protein [Candidatus Ichthyocystis sparus]|nr:hypothetical protein [Candidatus Ichthyocystis sparus]
MQQVEALPTATDSATTSTTVTTTTCEDVSTRILDVFYLTESD